ncbi:MAG TPA: FAD-dependent thymidylate synthase [Gemmatimonadales bacterium]|nr:FAD-dependent thymidylate synthase [Gemmatimonadales bacterium]
MEIHRSPRVTLIGRPQFLEPAHLPVTWQGESSDGERLAEFAGRLCYMSQHNPANRTTAEYLQNILKQGHGSVFEHAQYVLLLEGISRSCSHELVRHRAGFGYCLAGDTEIYSEHRWGGKRDGVRRRTIREIFDMSKTPHGRSRLKLLRLRSLDEGTGEFTTGRVKAVARSGVKPVFKVQLEDGKTITCSKDHRFLTPNGWERLEEITGKGAWLIVEGDRQAESNSPWASESHSALAVCAEAVTCRRIVSVTCAGEQETYDIEMEGPHHNFVANGIVTHNSQLSQRYVDESHAAFVMPPAIQGDARLEREWEAQVTEAQAAYVTAVEHLMNRYEWVESKVHRRKMAREAARSVLPNATEVKIVVSANVRAWRTMLELRLGEGAEQEIRRLAVEILKVLQAEAPHLFGDFEIYRADDGADAGRVGFHKV